jgi:RND family efflux transporter MFP subunit
LATNTPAKLDAWSCRSETPRSLYCLRTAHFAESRSKFDRSINTSIVSGFGLLFAVSTTKELQAEMTGNSICRFGGTGLLAVIAMLPIGCGQQQTHGAAKPPETAIKVIVALPIQQEVTDYMDYTGRTEAVESVDIRPRVSGYLTKVGYMGSLDSEVKEGALLFQIDERPYVNALESAKARVASAKAALKTNAAELERTEGLFKKGVSVQSDLDRDIGRKAQSDADIENAEAQLNQAKLDLEFTTITSPITGMISKPTTQSLTSVVSFDPIYVYFDLDEPSLLRIQQNIRDGKLPTGDEGEYKILLGLANDTGYPLSGVLDFVDNQVNPNTGTIRVRGIFKNPKPARGKRVLTPGLFARVRVPMGSAHSSLLISERAVGRDQGKSFVYIVGPENKVARRSVKLGAVHDGLRVVLPAEEGVDGIQSGDQVIISGLQRVRPGVTVEPIVKSMAGATDK